MLMNRAGTQFTGALTRDLLSLRGALKLRYVTIIGRKEEPRPLGRGSDK